MKKVSKFIIATILTVSISFSSVLPAHAVISEIIGAASLLVSCIQLISDSSDTSKKAEDARLVILHSWLQSIPASSTWIEVDPDSLYNACLELSRGGMPCKVASIYVNGFNIYVIRAIGEPYNLVTGKKVMVNSKITDCYFGSDQLGNETGKYLFYSLYPPSASSLDKIRISLQGLVTSLSTHLNKIEGYIDGIEGYIDGIESALSTTNSRLNTIAGRLIKTVDGTSYTLSDLAYNSYKQLQTIGGYVDNVEDKLTTEISLLTSLNTNVSSLVSMVSESHFMSSYATDSNGDPYPYQLIPADSASYIIGYLNSQYGGKDITVLPREGNSYLVKFNRAWLDSNRRIAISGRPYSGDTSYTFFLCDPRHVLFQVFSNPYESALSNLQSAVENVSINVEKNTTNNSKNVTTKLTNISGSVKATADATANIDLKLDSLIDKFSLDFGDINLNLGSILDKLDVGFDDIIGSIEGIPASSVSRSDLYLSSYTTDYSGIPYSIISSPYQSTMDIIGYINSEMVGQPITLLPRQGTRETALTRYVDHAYLDENNFLRVAAKTLGGAVYSYFLASPEMAIYQTLSGDDYSQSLSKIEKITNSIYEVNDAILAHLDSSDLSDLSFISDMVDDWGDTLVYSVLNSDNVLSLFNSAFGDLPPTGNWVQARNYFTYFYSGEE